MAGEPRPKTIAEAFEHTARALEQFSIERVRVEGLSGNITNSSNNSKHGGEPIRTLTERAFMREFLFHSRPCVIVGAIDDWPAMRRWRDDRYLFDLDGQLPLVCEDDSPSESNSVESEDDKSDSITNNNNNNNNNSVLCDSEKKLLPRRVTVALTPNGRADAVTYVTYCKETSKNDNTNSNNDTDRDSENTSAVVTEKLFMCAAEVCVSLPELYDLLRANPPQPPLRSMFVDMRRAGSVIAYAQMQNNCLAVEYQHLLADVHTELDLFGERVFGGPHEAANLWLGTPASVSSMHQDWVENLYAVVRGVKEFLLIPPWEGVFVPKPELPSAAYALEEEGLSNFAAVTIQEEEEGKKEEKKNDGGKYRFAGVPVKDGMKVPWMDIEITPAAVDDPTLISSELRDRVHPLVVYVQAGEVLYLPAMWLHRVAQHADAQDHQARELLSSSSSSLYPPSAPTNEGVELKCKNEPPLPLITAVNYWYDMSFTNPAVVMLREFGLLL